MHYHYPSAYPYYGYFGSPYAQWPYYAGHYHPTPCGGCGHAAHSCNPSAPLTAMKLPRELLADSTTTSSHMFIGGSSNVSLSLEYLKTGASATLKVTITESGQTTTWDLATLPDEYQIKENFTTVAPGAEVLLEVTDCTARLRWCEVVCC